MSSFSGHTIQLFGAVTKRAEAQGQGGLLTGTDPATFTSSDPLRLWIIQVGVIVMMAQVLSLVLRKLRQPKVIAEILGGILLGPTAFGRIPGFTQHIFPQESLPYLTLVADIGLCLFLFIIGLEINGDVIKRNGAKSAVIAIAGMALPFGLGAGLSVPLYHHFIDPSVKFTYFMLFTGVAYSITAFPVLCRILTELKLLDTQVGVIVLSAGVANDVVGWILLALSVALVNASTGLTALWILMVCFAFVLFLLFIVRRVMLYLARVTGSIDNGPTMVFMTVTMLVLFASAFFTDIIGVNAIFGAFLAGLVIPREGGLSIALTEKLEDMVTIVFLPLYFTISGLNTNLGLLDNGITWGFTIAIMALSFSGKFGGCTLGARAIGFSWRESSTIGALMSCKGLVELIVLNIGLQANILSQRVFSMFVLEAVVLTFMTTPLVTWLYPEMLQTSSRRNAQGSLAVDSEGITDSDLEEKKRTDDGIWRHRLTVVLDKLEHIPSLMSLTQLIHLDTPDVDGGASPAGGKRRPVIIDALRLIELSDRTSAVMRSSHADQLIRTDPLLSIFRTFAALHDMAVSAALSIVPYDDLAHRVSDHAKRNGAQLLVLPWLPPSAAPAPPSVDHDALSPATPRAAALAHNPFEAFFGASLHGDSTEGAHGASAIHSQFIRSVFKEARTDIALAVDAGLGSGTAAAIGSGSAHVFLPFFGGPDDRLALEFVAQLCANVKVRATVVRVSKRDVQADLAQPATALASDEKVDQELSNIRDNGMTIHSTFGGFPDTVYGNATTQTRLQSETADSVAWARFAQPEEDNADSDGENVAPVSSALRSALSRMEFEELASPLPLHAILTRVSQLKESLASSRTRILVLCGRSRRLAIEDHNAELKKLVEEHKGGGLGGGASEVHLVRKTIGDVGAAMLVGSTGTGMVVVQASQDDV